MEQVKNYNSTWWGRVLLMLRRDYYSYHRQIFMSLGFILIFFNLIARMGVLFDGDISDTWFRSFSVYARLAVIMPAIGIVSSLYINKRCQHSKALVFTMIPANLWEKVLSIGLGILLINVSAFLTTYLSIFIDGILAPSKVDISLYFGDILSFLYEGMSWKLLWNGVIILATALLTFLVFSTQLVQHKGYLKAMFLGFLYYAVGMYFFARLTIAMNLPDVASKIFVILIDIALTIYLWDRLRKLEV